MSEFPLVQGTDGLRRFSDTRIQTAIDSALAALEPGKSLAVVAHHVYHNDGTAVENVTKLSLVVRLPAGFSVAAAAYKDWTSGELGAEGEVVWSPF